MERNPFLPIETIIEKKCPFLSNTLKENNMLPRFLLADNSQEFPDSIYVVHTQKPRFIVGSDIEDFNMNQEIVWIDAEPKDKKIIEELLAEAEEFLEDELQNQDELYDEEDE